MKKIILLLFTSITTLIISAQTEQKELVDYLIIEDNDVLGDLYIGNNYPTLTYNSGRNYFFPFKIHNFQPKIKN